MNMSLFQRGKFQLHSGDVSDFKIDCDALTDEDIDTIAYLLSKVVGEFGSVIGIPTGGMRLARAMVKYSSTNGFHRTLPPLIVDDVYTTGRSMEEAREHALADEVKGAVIFARTSCPDWITPLFQMRGQR